jgi:hypothetical protein
MKVFQPQISVKLIKAFKRKEIVPGVPVVLDRYGNLEGIDLTSLLGDGCSVRTTKSVRQPAGAFTITLVDKPASELFFETVYALIEPMDMVEIRMAREAGVGELPIIMRGFVSSITRDESMRGDKPERSVSISGQDFGKILQILQVMYLYNTVVGDYFLTEFKWFENFAHSSDIKTMPAAEFVQSVVEHVINPYMANIASLARLDETVKSMSTEVSIDGWISPWTLNFFDNTSFYSLLRACLDAPMWNELYVEDREDGVTLVVRPVPYKRLDGTFIQGKADHSTIDSTSIMSQNVSRTDVGVANFYWVTNSRWCLLNDADQMALALAGDKESFVTTKYLNSAKDYFGIRKMEVETTLGPGKYRNSDSVRKEEQAQQVQSIEEWLVSRRKLLAELNKDNVIYESGALRLRGDESIKAGTYISILRGPNAVLVGEVYAHTVSHDFIPYQGFFTTIQFDRGTMFANRAQQKNPRYVDEIEAQGVY